MLKYLVPIFQKGTFIAILKISFLGSLVAGFYGIFHDQITFTISNEYFSKLKYQQFGYLNFVDSDRLKVSMIGFLATWWVGLFLGWFLARWFVPHNSLSIARIKIFKSFIIIFAASTMLATVSGLYVFLFGNSINYLSWAQIINTYNIENTWAFVGVAYIHNASYLGALLGLLMSLILVKR